MAILKTSLTPNRGEVTICGSFTTDVGGAAVADVTGSGFAVARTGAGTYQVTLAEFPARVLSIIPSVGFAAGAPDDVICQSTTFDVTNNRFSVVLWDVSGTAAADKTSRVSFVIKYSNSISP